MIDAVREPPPDARCVGLDGDLGDGNWTWNAYYERSETHQFETGLNNRHYGDLSMPRMPSA